MRQSRQNIIIHQKMIPEYRIPIFNSILKKNSNITIVYGKPNTSSSLKNGKIPIGFNYKKVKNLFIGVHGNWFISSIYCLIFKTKPQIIITQYSPSNLNIFLLYILRPILKFKIIGWFHGWNRKRDFSTNRTLYDRLRHFMLKQADAIILYSEDAKNILSSYKNPTKIFVANNTLDTKKFARIRDRFQDIGRERLKKELNFKSKYNLIFSGRLEKEKHPEDLLNVFQLLQKSLGDITLHIIGSGTLEEKLRFIVLNKDLKNIIFYGSIYDDELTGKMIYCSDLMIIPGWVGLSIVHSFCFECPIVTFDEKFHAPEIIYLSHGKTGYILGNFSNADKVEIIKEYLLNSKLQNEFRNSVIKMIETNANVDKMTGEILAAIDSFL